MLRVTLKGVRGHLVRFLLTALSVMLGVSLIAGAYVLTDSIDNTFETLVSSSLTGTNVVVRGPEAGQSADGTTTLHAPVPISLDTRIAAVDGVKRVSPDIQGTALLVGRDGTAVRNAGAPTFGFAYSPQNEAFTLAAGRAPENAGEVAVESKTLKKSGLAIGDRTQVLVAGRPTSATVVGDYTFEGGSAGATIVILPTAEATAAFAPDGTVQSISVTADSGVSDATLRDRVEKALPVGLQVITAKTLADETRASIDTILGFISTFLLVFAAVALFVGGFIIANTFSMLVAQRTRELALLRAMGASRGQVVRVVLGEAVVIGFVGSLLGLGVGIGLARLLQWLMSLAGLDISGGLPVRARTVIVCLVVGVLVTLVSAVFPALRAARIPPIAALRDDGVLPQSSLRRRGIVASVLGVVALAMLLPAVLADDVRWLLVGGGAGLLVIALVTGAPLLARPLVRLVSLPFVARRSAVGRLARENSLRNPRRTAVTASALMIGLALIGAISVIAQSTKASVSDIVADQLKSDYVLTAGQSPIPATVAQAVSSLPDVRSAFQISFLQVKTDVPGGSDLSAVGADPGPLTDNVKLDVTSGSLGVLEDGEVLLSRSTADDRRWGVGTTVPATLGTLVGRQLKVGGIFEDNTLLGADMIIPRSLYDTATPAADRSSFGVLVRADSGADLPRLRSELVSAVKPYLVVAVENGDEFVDAQAAQVNQLLYLLYALLALSVIIAVLGIINTLALSVFERTREIGLLRAVGLGRRQLRRMIRIEAVTTAVFGAVLGVALGVALGIAVQYGLRTQGLDQLAIPWITLVVVLIAAAMAGVVAALVPAWRAGRMDVLRAIITE